MADISNISTTRSELLTRKQQLELTRAGYDLLDKKRVALMQEILRLQDEVVRLATDLQVMTAKSRRALAKAEALIGTTGVRSATMGKKHEIQIELEDSLLMGVHVPKVKAESAQRDFFQRDLCITGTSPVVDEAAEAFEQNVDGIVVLADGEFRLSKLMKEILRTTRRLKALEHIIIPRLQSEYNYISMALEERERSEHFSMKLAKKLISRKNQIARERRLARQALIQKKSA
jgi:V/A-type H+/Na+-transporting ATPase subunit D